MCVLGEEWHWGRARGGSDLGARDAERAALPEKGVGGVPGSRWGKAPPVLVTIKRLLRA